MSKSGGAGSNTQKLKGRHFHISKGKFRKYRFDIYQEVVELSTLV